MNETGPQMTGNGREQDMILAAARSVTAALPASDATARAVSEGEAVVAILEPMGLPADVLAAA